MTRLLLLLHLVFGFACAPAARACDDLLLALIEGKEKKGEFDQMVEMVSTYLRRAVDDAKQASWRGVDDNYRKMLGEWLKIYTKFLSAPPEGFIGQKDWPGTLAGYSARFKALGDLVAARQYEPFHDEVLAIHASLMQLYIATGEKSRTQALNALLEPLELILATSGHGIQRGSNLLLRLDMMKQRLETLAPLVTVPEQQALVTDIKSRIVKLMEKPDSFDDATLETEVDQLHALATSFKVKFVAAPN